MFNLIITIIAIALVVVLTATSVFYGGDAFSEGSTDAIAATYINQAQQVQGAFTLFKARTGAHATEIKDLTDDSYLSSAPKSPSDAVWVLDGDYVSTGTIALKSDNKAGMSPEVCKKINKNGSGLVECFKFDNDAATSAAESNTDAAIDALTAGTDSVVVVMAR